MVYGRLSRSQESKNCSTKARLDWRERAERKVNIPFMFLVRSQGDG